MERATASQRAELEPFAAKPALLIVGNFLSGAGRARGVCEDLAERLAAAGWPVRTASSHPGRVRRLMDMLATTWRARRSYDVAQVDVFSGNSFLWAELVCAVLRGAGKPYILTLHGGNLSNFARRWPMRVRKLLGTAAAVTTPSRYLLDEMRPYRQDLRLLPNPLSVNAYRFRLRRRPRPRLLWLRAFHAIYNPALAPEVLALLLEEFPDVRLTMVGPCKGDGSLQEMRQVASELNVANRIHITGGVPKSEVADWMSRGDIFLNTTNVDNTPISILESMACGLSVVSTKVGGIPYLLEDEKDALLVPPEDAAAMAAAVRRILIEPGLGERLSRAARAKVEQYDWSNILPQWEALLAAVAEGRAG